MWRAPIVGTSPITTSGFRWDSSVSRTSLTLWTTRTDILYIRARCRQDRFGKLRILLGKRRNRTIRKAECVVADQDLAIALRAGADSDRRNFQACGDAAGKVVGDRFENDGEDAGLLQ